jgi:hypothetical protein
LQIHIFQTGNLSQIAFALGLVSVILGAASGAQNVGIIGAFGVGGCIGLAGLWGSPISGASMNPARTFGPDPARPRACRGLPVGVRGDHRGGRAAGDERGDAAQVDSPGCVDAGQAPGVSSEAAREIRELKPR